jgi:hypothetical protein
MRVIYVIEPEESHSQALDSFNYDIGLEDFGVVYFLFEDELPQGDCLSNIEKHEAFAPFGAVGFILFKDIMAERGDILIFSSQIFADQLL